VRISSDAAGVILSPRNERAQDDGAVKNSNPPLPPFSKGDNWFLSISFSPSSGAAKAA